MLTRIYKLSKTIRRLEQKRAQGHRLNVAESAYLQIAKQDLRREWATSIAEYSAEGGMWAILLWCCGTTGLWAALGFSCLTRAMFWLWVRMKWW